MKTSLLFLIVPNCNDILTVFAAEHDVPLAFSSTTFRLASVLCETSPWPINAGIDGLSVGLL